MTVRIKWHRRIANAAVTAVLALCFFPALGQENARAIGSVIAPPELISAYSCTTYAEAFFFPKVEARAKVVVQGAIDKQAALKRLLSQYDNVLHRMCRETQVLFQRRRSEVLDIYARQLPGDKTDITPGTDIKSASDIRLFLAHPSGKRWASESAVFLGATAPLIQYYALVKSVAPKLLDNPEATPDYKMVAEVGETSVGKAAQDERTQLILLLADDGFAKLAPSRFDLAFLKAEEARLRKEAARLRNATVFKWFNDNASDLVRMHFNGFDVMRRTGLVEIYHKYELLMNELLRQI